MCQTFRDRDTWEVPQSSVTERGDARARRVAASRGILLVLILRRGVKGTAPCKELLNAPAFNVALACFGRTSDNN